MMSKAKRARHHSLHFDLSNGQLDSLPSVAAVFLILFDVKAGYASHSRTCTIANARERYTIAWRRIIPGRGSAYTYYSVVYRLILLTVDIAESVEFKSLPSGLHNVREDLM